MNSSRGAAILISAFMITASAAFAQTTPPTSNTFKETCKAGYLYLITTSSDGVSVKKARLVNCELKDPYGNYVYASVKQCAQKTGDIYWECTKSDCKHEVCKEGQSVSGSSSAQPPAAGAQTQSAGTQASTPTTQTQTPTLTPITTNDLQRALQQAPSNMGQDSIVPSQTKSLDAADQIAKLAPGFSGTASGGAGQFNYLGPSVSIGEMSDPSSAINKALNGESQGGAGISPQGGFGNEQAQPTEDNSTWWQRAAKEACQFVTLGFGCSSAQASNEKTDAQIVAESQQRYSWPSGPTTPVQLQYGPSALEPKTPAPIETPATPTQTPVQAPPQNVTPPAQIEPQQQPQQQPTQSTQPVQQGYYQPSSQPSGYQNNQYQPVNTTRQIENFQQNQSFPTGGIFNNQNYLALNQTPSGFQGGQYQQNGVIQTVNLERSQTQNGVGPLQTPNAAFFNTNLSGGLVDIGKQIMGFVQTILKPNKARRVTDINENAPNFAQNSDTSGEQRIQTTGENINDVSQAQTGQFAQLQAETQNSPQVKANLSDFSQQNQANEAAQKMYEQLQKPKELWTNFVTRTGLYSPFNDVAVSQPASQNQGTGSSFAPSGAVETPQEFASTSVQVLDVQSGEKAQTQNPILKAERSVQSVLGKIGSALLGVFARIGSLFKFQ